MNRLNRALQGMTQAKILSLLVLGSFCLLIGIEVLSIAILGMAMLGLAGIIAVCHLISRFLNNHYGWEPNVHGENPYQILGVTKNADAATIRCAFRERERTHHPDAMPDDKKAEAAALFIRINQAYELLSDREKRYEYDHLLGKHDGVVPPFDEAFQQIKDVHKHEIYEEFDVLYPPAPALSPKFADPSSLLPPPAVAEPPVPVEVDMPESVRESLGLPPPTDRPSSPGGENIQD